MVFLQHSDPRYFKHLSQNFAGLKICLQPKEILTKNYFGSAIFGPTIFVTDNWILGWAENQACNVSLTQLVSPNMALLAKLFGQSGSSSPYKWLFRHSVILSVCLSLLASREVSRVAIGFKAV